MQGMKFFFRKPSVGGLEVEWFQEKKHVTKVRGINVFFLLTSR